MTLTKPKNFVVGITGASGAIYGIRLIETLLSLGYSVHLVVSNAGWRVFKEELGYIASDREGFLNEKFKGYPGSLIYHPVADIGASIASGSFRVEGMIIMPCSMGTLSAVANGTSDNLMTRAADVMLKEGRPLVLVPRETPLHAIHLENMLKLSRLGVRIIPAMPAFYFGPQSMDDLINFMVGKVLDSFNIEHQLFRRWGIERMENNSHTIIGKISYTNSWPVFHNFHPSALKYPAEMVSEVPAILNQGMSRGTIHVGALSSFAYAEASDKLLLLPDLSVSADGPVRSIFLFSRVPLAQIGTGTIAVTNTSATSVNLLKILMEKAFGNKPEYISANPDLDAMMHQADACLLIGDHAIKASWQDQGYIVTDLAELWKEWTGLGMTFAVWAVNRKAANDKPEAIAEIAEAFAESKLRGLNDLDPIVLAACTTIGGTKSYWEGYFRNLCYDFGERQQKGLNLYFRYAYEMGLLPQAVKMEIWSHKLLTRVKE